MKPAPPHTKIFTRGPFSVIGEHHNSPAAKLNLRSHGRPRPPDGTLFFPYAKADPPPTPQDPVATVYVDDELGREGLTFTLASGAEGSVHLEQVLEYNRDPGYMRDLLLYRLTLEAERRVVRSPLSRREIIRRLGTSPAQFYRLLDPTNNRKSVDAVLALLQVLDCEVELVVKP